MNEAISAAIKERVEAWQIAFEVPVDLDLQDDLIIEEAKELIEIFTSKEPSPESLAEVLKEASDLLFVIVGYILMAGDDTKPVLSIEADAYSKVAVLMLDTTFESVPAFDDLLLEAFNRVCDSNMSKLDNDGKVLRREDGKLLKGPNYSPPDLTDLGEKLFAQVLG